MRRAMRAGIFRVIFTRASLCLRHQLESEQKSQNTPEHPRAAIFVAFPLKISGISSDRSLIVLSYLS